MSGADITAGPHGHSGAETAAVVRGRFGRVCRQLAVHAILIVGVLLVLTPFVWMILTSIKDPSDIFTEPFSLSPDALRVTENYGHAVTVVPILRFMLNGIIVVLGILSVQLLTSIPCAYALAKLNFRGRPLLLGFIIFALCIPIQVPAIPIYLGLARADLLDSYFALMFPWFLSAFAIFLFRQFFKSYPDEIIAAARMDGFTEIDIVARLIVPSALPAIAAFSVFSITAHWNDLYWPLVVVTSTDLMTPPLGMLFFRDSETGTNYGALMAGATIVTAPLVVVFLLAQRQFIQGVTMTGIK